MSLMDAPLALVDRLLGRPPAVAPDEPMVRMLERLSRSIEPDPAYRRRLRGEALNRFVAAREGIAPPTPARARRMTPIGRAVLVASVVLATSAASAAAASQTALPGDALYGLKLRIEELRIEVAPGDLKDELVVAALDARLAEIGRLADDGQWPAAREVAMRAAAIAADLIAMAPATSPASELALSHDVAVLEALVAEAPPAAVPALQKALDASSSAASVIRANGWRAADGPNPPGHAGDSASGDPAATGAPGNGPGTNNGQGPGSNTANAGAGSDHDDEDASIIPSPSASPSASPTPAPTPLPAATPQPSHMPRPTPSPAVVPPGPAATPHGG